MSEPSVPLDKPLASKHLRVLVVDDTPANIDLLKGLLREHYRIKAATSGEKALAIAAKADIPVFFVTGRLDPAERATGLALGALDYLLKPVDPERLLERVAAVLDTHS